MESKMTSGDTFLKFWRNVKPFCPRDYDQPSCVQTGESSREGGFVGHASKFSREVFDGLLRIGFLYRRTTSMLRQTWPQLLSGAKFGFRGFMTAPCSRGSVCNCCVRNGRFPTATKGSGEKAFLRRKVVNWPGGYQGKV
jgi:hypothetical protein